MSRRRYFIKRIVGMVVTYFAIATIVYFLFRQIGDPVGLHISSRMSQEEIESIKASFGLNRPWYVQYYNYLENILLLNWGSSFYYMESTQKIVINRLFNSLLLTLPSILIAYVFGTIGGIYLGWTRGSKAEKGGLLLALIFRSVPRFWLGLALIFVFGSKLGWFPMSGMLPAGAASNSYLDLFTRPEFYMHIILPIISMTLYLMGLPLLLMRTNMLEVKNEDFVDIVRAKGANERTVMYKHVARNALLPVTTAFAVAIGFSFGGSILVETVFSYPGVGRLMVNSVFRSDFPVAQFSFLLMAAVILFMNLLADLVYGYLDPRVVNE